MVGPSSNTVTKQQLISLQIEMGRRAVVAGGVQFVLFVVFFLFAPFPSGRPLGATAALSVLAATVALRAVVAWLQHTKLPDPHWLGFCTFAFRAVIMLGALTWSLVAVSTVLLYGVAPPASVILIFVLGIAMLSLQNFGLDLWLVRAFVLTLCGPVTWLMLLHPSEPAVFVEGCGYLAYVGFLLFLSSRTHALLWEALAGRTTIQVQRDQLSAVLEALPGFIVWMDRDDTILGANEKLARAEDAPPGSMVGRHIDEVLRDRSLVDTIRTFRKSPASESLIEVDLSSADAPRWALLALHKYGEGDRHLVAIGLDIGDRKRAEAERDHARALAAQSSRLAELGAMAAGIGHEINNPLQALSYGLGILRKQLETPTLSREQLTAEGLRVIKRAAATIQRIAAIVQGLRSIAREDTSAVFAPVDVSEVIREVQDVGGATIPPSGLALRVELPAEALIVEGRRAQIGQVVVNLVNNACEAVSSGANGDGAPSDKWVRVQARDVGDAVEISVEDSGPGIPVAVREQLMVPFFTTKEVGAGTGLGLSISKAIVDQHHGQLFLDSASLHTRFVVMLPKSHEHASP